MHPSADTLPIIFGNRSWRRVMPGVRFLLSGNGRNEEIHSRVCTQIYQEIATPFVSSSVKSKPKESV